MIPKLIRLSYQTTKDLLWINVNFLVSIHPKDKGSYLTLSNGTNLMYYNVEETMEEVINKINKAMDNK